MNRRYHYNIHTRVWIFSIGDNRINIRKQQYIFVFSVLFIPFVLHKKKKNRNPVIRLVWQAKSAFFITCIKIQIRECVCETTYSITSVDFCKIRTIILIATLKLINDHWGLFWEKKYINGRANSVYFFFFLVNSWNNNLKSLQTVYSIVSIVICG